MTVNYYNAVVINEIRSNGDASIEWIELYNTNDTNSVDLTGWTVSDQDGQNTFTFNALYSDTTIAPDGYLVLNVSSGTNSTGWIYWQRSTPVWDDAGDDVVLNNSDGRGVDYMQYGSGSALDPCPAEQTWSGTLPAPSQGTGFARYPNGIETDASADWATGVGWSPPQVVGVTLSPGEENVWIPEYETILIPIGTMILILMVIGRTRRNKYSTAGKS
jgi:hypothetical protein